MVLEKLFPNYCTGKSRICQNSAAVNLCSGEVRNDKFDESVGFMNLI